MNNIEPTNSWETSIIEPMRQPARRRDGTPVIFVSLYLLLLAFFIFLQSISVLKEERVRDVLGSVNIAFKGLSTETPTDEEKKLSGEEQGTQQFRAKLRNVFETAVPLVESPMTEGGTRLQFTVSLDQVFKYETAEIWESQESFLSEVAATLIDRNLNTATDIEILIGTGPELPEGDIEDNLASQRVDKLAETLLARGVPSRNLSLGLTAGDAGQVNFSFFVRPNLNFEFRPEPGQ